MVKMALAVVLAIVALLAVFATAAVVYTFVLERRFRAAQDALRDAQEARPKDGVSRDEINRVFAEMQASNQKSMDGLAKSMAALTPTPTRSAGGGGGGGGSGTSASETRTIKDDLERYNTSLSSKLVEQERTLRGLRDSVLAYTTSMVQQEQLIGAMRSTSAQQGALLSTIKGIQDVNVMQEAAINRLAGVQQEAPPPPVQVQPDDLAKRANLMAIVYYNALRDKTPGQSLQWDLINKHMYTCGMKTGSLYTDGPIMVDTFTTIVGGLPYQNKHRAGDVVNYLSGYLATYVPRFNNPNGLKIFDLERELNSGGTFKSIATTYGALDPNAEFYPPDQPDQSLGIPRGDRNLYEPIIDKGYPSRVQALADAVAATKATRVS